MNHSELGICSFDHDGFLEAGAQCAPYCGIATWRRFLSPSLSGQLISYRGWWAVPTLQFWRLLGSLSYSLSARLIPGHHS